MSGQMSNFRKFRIFENENFLIDRLIEAQLIGKQEHLGATSHHRSREPACRPGHSILVVYVRPAESEP